MLSEPTSIQNYMIRRPKCISEEAPLHEALQIMHEMNVKYLPVMSGSRLVGILKENAARAGVSLLGSEHFKVGDWMSGGAAVAAPDKSLFEVLDETPNNIYGCTVIQNDKGNVVGIFTPKEALLAMMKLATQAHRPAET